MKNISYFTKILINLFLLFLLNININSTPTPTPTPSSTPIETATAFETKLLASDGLVGDSFGFAISTSGDIVIIGAWNDDSSKGSAYIFELVNGTWTQMAKLLANDGSANDNFGWSVSISGNTAIVGAPYDDDNGSCSGSAYIFEKINGTWTQTAKLTANDGASSDSFGIDVSISGETAIIGAYYDDDKGYRSGAAYIFEKVNGTWTQTAKLLASDGAAYDDFGYSVSISGDTAIIGAYRDDDNGSLSGSTYIFEKTDGTWTQKAKLLANDGSADDWFGYSVSISGDTAIVGAYYDDDNGSASGSAYIFEKINGTWTQTTKLKANDGATADWFGFSASISGDIAIIGAYGDDYNGNASGSAYIFEKIDGTWTQRARLLANDGSGGDLFGISVSISENTAIIGASEDDYYGIWSGSAYIFNKVNETWTQTTKLLASDGSTDDLFGGSVSISGDTAIIGACGVFWENRNNDSGAAYIFEKTDVTWTQTAKLLANDGSADDGFGASVSISGDSVIVGATRDDDKGTDSGSAYVFDLSLLPTPTATISPTPTPTPGINLLVNGDFANGDSTGWTKIDDNRENGNPVIFDFNYYSDAPSAAVAVPCLRVTGISNDTGWGDVAEGMIYQSVYLYAGTEYLLDASVKELFEEAEQYLWCEAWITDFNPNGIQFYSNNPPDGARNLVNIVWWNGCNGFDGTFTSASSVGVGSEPFTVEAEGTYYVVVKVGCGISGNLDILLDDISLIHIGTEPTPTLSPTPGPSIPQGLKVKAGADSIRLSWNPNPEADISGYNIYRDSSASGSFSDKINSSLISETEYIDSSLNFNDTWYYKISAVNSLGLESNKTDAVFATVGSLYVTIPDYRGAANTNVVMQINVENATGISGNGIDIKVTYDTSLLTPVEVQKTYLTQDFTEFDNITGNPDDPNGQVNISALSEGGAVMNGEGHLFDIVFHVDQSAQSPETGNHTFVNVILYDENLNPLTVDYSDTAIFTVSNNYMLGDVNGDATITSVDALLALRYAIGMLELTTDPPQLQAADVNGDGVVDSADVSLILRLAVGLPINPDGETKALKNVNKSITYNLSMPEVSGGAGDTIEIPISTDNSTGIAGMDFTINYDPELLSLLNVKKDGLTNTFIIDNYSPSTSSVNISLSNPTAILGTGGNLVVLEFQVLDIAKKSSLLHFGKFKLSGEYGENLAWKNQVIANDGQFDTGSDVKNWMLY